MRTCLLVPVLFFSLLSHAQDTQPSNRTMAEQRSVARYVETFRSAMISADSATLLRLTSTGLSYGHSTGRIENRAEFITSLTSGKSDFIDIDLKEQQVTISGNTAVVRHLLHAKTNDNGRPGVTDLRVMQVWQKRKGFWYLLARQAVKPAS